MKATKQKVTKKNTKAFLDPFFFPSVSSSIETFPTATYIVFFLGWIQI
jgi:hypothetical protein